jgi:hypothetical protein
VLPEVGAGLSAIPGEIEFHTRSVLHVGLRL